mgnify:CR=1 FL=1
MVTVAERVPLKQGLKPRVTLVFVALMLGSDKIMSGGETDPFLIVVEVVSAIMVSLLMLYGIASSMDDSIAAFKRQPFLAGCATVSGIYCLILFQYKTFIDWVIAISCFPAIILFTLFAFKSRLDWIEEYKGLADSDERAGVEYLLDRFDFEAQPDGSYVMKKKEEA